MCPSLAHQMHTLYAFLPAISSLVIQTPPLLGLPPKVRERSPERTNQPNAGRSDAGEHRYAGKKRKGAPGGSGGAPPPKRALVQGVTLAKALLGVGVAGPEVVVSGSPSIWCAFLAAISSLVSELNI